jgi:PKD repeat protein
MKRPLHAKTSFMLILLLAWVLVTVLPSSAQSSLNVSVETDKPSYILRELINVSGIVTYNEQLVEEGLVGIQVNEPNGKKLTVRTMPLGPITSGGPVFGTVKILSVIPCDGEGNLKRTFERGTNAHFKATAKNTYSFDKWALIVITIYDSDLIPLGIIASEQTIAAESTASLIGNIWIDEWASVGNAPIYANAYTDWPENDGYPYHSPEKSGNFTIIASKYEEPPNNQIPEQPVRNGTYQTHFKLSPEPPPGTYEVSVSAWFRGLTAFSETTFQVEDTVAPPRASFVAKPPLTSPDWEITFDASSSTAEGYGDTITSYNWDFGDETSDTGQIVKHSYPDLGNYTVTLNVTDSEGFWNTTSREVAIMIIHDVAITNLECLERVYDDWEVSITVNVKNEGTTTETFNVTVYINSSTLDTKQINLEPYEEETLTFTWNTTGLPLLSNYTLEAVASGVENDIDIADNSQTYGPILVAMKGDIAFNREIDLFDAVILLSIYGSKEGDPYWNIMADLRRDGAINLFDAVILLSRYGTSY